MFQFASIVAVLIFLAKISWLGLVICILGIVIDGSLCGHLLHLFEISESHAKFQILNVLEFQLCDSLKCVKLILNKRGCDFFELFDGLVGLSGKVAH